MSAADSTPAFSRNGVTSPFGKLDARMETFKVESIVLEEFKKKATAANKPAAELLREFMRIVAFGPDTVKSMHCESVDRVVGMVGKKL